MKTTVALIAAPLLAVAARLLMTPEYQDDADQFDTTRYLAALTEAGARNDAGALIATLSAMLYVASALALAGIVKSRLGTVGAALSIVGAFGLAAHAVFVLTAGRLREESDRGAAAALLERLYNAPVFTVFFLATLAGAVGAVLLAIGLYRGRQVPRGAALLWGIGGAGLMVTTQGPLLSFVVGGALLALAGLTWIAVGTTEREPVEVGYPE
ncbi:hypothetical protein [Kribbella sp. CA-247076]|uniref:hypothetical protein n=1 Tax=Kribbella sp. CA-247076 TaxID=3239941 RepID=UPI003D8B43DF